MRIIKVNSTNYVSEFFKVEVPQSFHGDDGIYNFMEFSAEALLKIGEVTNRAETDCFVKVLEKFKNFMTGEDESVLVSYHICFEERKIVRVVDDIPMGVALANKRILLFGVENHFLMKEFLSNLALGKKYLSLVREEGRFGLHVGKWKTISERYFGKNFGRTLGVFQRH